MPPADSVFVISAGNGPAGALLTVGLTNTYWNKTQVLDTHSNSDGMHVFRLAYDADGLNGFQVWRDGVQIGTNRTFYSENNSVLYFGDGGYGHGGIGAFDYVRWTMGVFAPVPPPPSEGTLILLN